MSIGPCWKFDLWPINFDLLGHIYSRSIVHWMFYQITYGGPACACRCSDIAKYANLTPFFQEPEITLNDIWPRSLSIQVTLVNGLPYVQMISICCVVRVRYEFLFRYLDSDFVFDPCDPKWPRIKKNNLITFVEGLKLYHMHKSHDHAT